MPPEPKLVDAFAPAGKLRASINLGNPVLANRDPKTGEPVGVSIDLATELARRLGVGLELVVFDAAKKSVDAVSEEQADIGFFAIDPARGERIAFTDAYVLIEGSYLVRDDSPIRSNDEVDRAGHRIVVGKGSAYDLFLTREIRHATLIPSATTQTVIDTFLTENAEVAASVRPALEAEAKEHPGLRLLAGRFMVIRQAMGLPKSRGADAAAYLAAYVEEQKANGFVADALKRHRIDGGTVAPAA